MKKYSLLLATLLASFFFTDAEACTGLKCTPKNKQAVHGRTLEFGVDVDTSIVFIPKNIPFVGKTTQGKGLAYNTKYASVGAIATGDLLILDGMNENGLAVGTFYFPGYASYAPLTKENQSKALSPSDFPNWVVTQFGTLEEVKQGINDIIIVPTPIPEWGPGVPPFHYIVYDKKGDSIVIEPINGKLEVSDNNLGVLTNSPEFNWHMTNLRNYINLTPNNVPPLKVDGLVFAPFGHGSGMVGLPGDFTPPSRFVRAAIFSVTATPSNNANEAVFQTFHILNQFDIPIGIAREVSDGIVYTDHTLATVVRDPHNMKYYFRTYDDQTIHCVDFNTFDKSGKEVLQVNTSSKQPYVDVSKDLKPIKSA